MEFDGWRMCTEAERAEEGFFLPLLGLEMERDHSSCGLNVEVLSPEVYHQRTKQVKLGFGLFLDLPAAVLGSVGGGGGGYEGTLWL